MPSESSQGLEQPQHALQDSDTLLSPPSSNPPRFLLFSSSWSGNERKNSAAPAQAPEAAGGRGGVGERCRLPEGDATGGGLQVVRSGAAGLSLAARAFAVRAKDGVACPSAEFPVKVGLSSNTSKKKIGAKRVVRRTLPIRYIGSFLLMYWLEGHELINQQKQFSFVGNTCTSARPSN